MQLEDLLTLVKNVPFGELREKLDALLGAPTKKLEIRVMPDVNEDGKADARFAYGIPLPEALVPLLLAYIVEQDKTDFQPGDGNLDRMDTFTLEGRKFLGGLIRFGARDIATHTEIAVETLEGEPVV